jgi:chromosomal replication initiation ATPase DnaA
MPWDVLALNTVTTILANEMLLAKQRLIARTVAQDVADRLGIPLNVLGGPGHRACIVTARHVAM